MTFSRFITSKYFSASVLVSILILGSILRVTGLDKRGYLFADERAYHNSAKKITVIIRQSKLKGNETSEEKRTKFKKFLSADRHLNLFAKPTHVLITTIGQLLIPSEKDYGDLYISAMSGMLTIMVVFFTASRLANKNYSLMAAFLLAVLPVHVFYSRANYAQSHQILFISIAILFYIIRLENLKEPKEAALSILTGLFLGISFTCHPGSLPFLFAFIAFDLYLLVNKKIYKESFFKLLVSIPVPLLFYEAIFVFIKIYTDDTVLLFNSSYLLQIASSILSGTSLGGLGYELSNGWLFPLIAFSSFLNYVPMAIFLIGLFVFVWQTLRERNLNKRFLVTILFVPYILFALGTKANHSLRMYAYVIPIIPLLIAIFLSEISNWLKKKEKKLIYKFKASTCISFILLVIISITFLKEDVKIISLKSPYLRLEQHMTANKIKQFMAKDLWIYIDGIENVPIKNWEGAKNIYKEKGTKYFLLNEFYFLKSGSIEVFEKLKNCKLLIGDVPGIYVYKPMRYVSGIPKTVNTLYDSDPRTLKYNLYDISGCVY